MTILMTLLVRKMHITCNKQRNQCFTPTRKSKQPFFGNINLTDLTDYTRFGKTVKPFLKDKVTNLQKTTATEKRKKGRKEEQKNDKKKLTVK